MPLVNQSHLFDIPEDVTYLNIASQSPIFKSIYDVGLQGLKQKQLPYTITTLDYFEPVAELKQLFAQLIDANDYNRIAPIPSVSYGMATVANNITLKPGDEILVIDEQFPSNIYSWQKLADKFNASIKTIEMPTARLHRAEQWNFEILNAITAKTKVVAMGHIHWSNGTLFNLKKIREKSKLHNALLIIDGSQTIGAFPFSIKDIQPDALICAGYKWLFGPYGCAYAYYGEYFDNGNPIEENWSNRLHSENFAGLTNYEAQYKPFSNRYSVGESGNFIYIKMQIEALKQILKWTPKAIQEYCKLISEDTSKALEKLGCFIEDSNFRSHHLFGFELPNHIDIQNLKKELFKRQIFVSFRGNYIRISCHVYNSKTHFKTLVNCIEEVILNV